MTDLELAAALDLLAGQIRASTLVEVRPGGRRVVRLLKPTEVELLKEAARRLKARHADS